MSFCPEVMIKKVGRYSNFISEKKTGKADLAFKSSVSYRRCRVDHSSGLLRLVDDNCLVKKTAQSMLNVNAVDYTAVISVVM